MGTDTVREVDVQIVLDGDEINRIRILRTAAV